MERRFTSIFRYLFSCATVLLRGLICGRDTGARESLVAWARARSLTINLGFGTPACRTMCSVQKQMERDGGSATLLRNGRTPVLPWRRGGWFSAGRFFSTPV